MSLKRKRLGAAVVAGVLLAVGVTVTWAIQPKELLPDELRGAVGAPRYLSSFGNEGRGSLSRPVDVLVEGNSVYVTDSRSGTIVEYDRDGDHRRTFEQGKLVSPAYLARHPGSGNIYVTDRAGAVQIFSPAGDHLGEFGARSATGTVDWQPLGIAFGRGGDVYVSDTRGEHEVFIVASDGGIVRRIPSSEGTTSAIGRLDFPNGVESDDGTVWVADSNRRRVLELDGAGRLRKALRLKGLSRGIAVMAPRGVSWRALLVTDAFSGQVLMLDRDGGVLAEFGRKDSEGRPLSYPNGVDSDEIGRVYVTDIAGGKVDVYGWGRPDSTGEALVRFWPLLVSLLPASGVAAWAFRARPVVFVTPDLLCQAEKRSLVEEMASWRVDWRATAGTFAHLPDEPGWRALEGHLRPLSASDRAIARLADSGVEPHAASTLAASRKADVLASEDVQLASLARGNAVETMGLEELRRRFGRGGDSPDVSGERRE